MNFINKNQFTQIISLLIFSLVIMMIIRLTLFNFYPNDFSDLTTSELLSSFFMGFRVDIITVFTLSSIFILPLLAITHTKIRLFIILLWALILTTIFLLSFSDVLYFDYIHRHMSNELLLLTNDMDIIIGMAFGSLLKYTIISVLFSISFLFLIYKIFKQNLLKPITGKKLLLFSLITIIFIALGIRNKVSGKSFGISDAYSVNKVSSGNIALNGFFTFYRTIKTVHKHDLMKLDQAIKIIKIAQKSSQSNFSNPNYPLQKTYFKQNKAQYNVVIVLLESFGAEHIDGFTHYKELNITPYFKKLSQDGIKFTNFYSNGYRSIFGITSLFTGITIPKGMQYLGRGLELSNLSYLGNIAKQNGYSTISMQASNRRSYRVDSVSTLAGFDQYYGASDMPDVETVDEGRSPHTGTYDFNMFDFYHHKLNNMKEPFLGFAFTASTHSDFHLPSAKFERFPHNLKNYNGSLNSYIYADNAIKRFMQGVKKEPWFDRTIFIFTSDHGTGDALNPIGKKYRPHDIALSPIEHFRIPLIIYAPKIFKAQEIDTLGCHNDIFATIIDMLGWKAKITTMGTSLFDKSIHERFVYFFAGNLIGLITDKGYIKYNFKNIVEKSNNLIDEHHLKELLFAADTAEAKLLKQNKWTTQ